MKYERDGNQLRGEEARAALWVIYVHAFLAKLLTALTGIVQLAIILVPLVFLFPEMQFAVLAKGNASSIVVVIFSVLFLATKPGPAKPGGVSFKPFS